MPPIVPRTDYVVSAELGRRGAEAGRTDRFTVEEATATDGGDNGPMRVRRLFRVVPAARQDSGPPLTEE